MSFSSPVILHYWVSLLLRYFVLTNLTPRFDLTHRVEVANPINSDTRLTEGIFLYNHGEDPYSGVLFHEPPLVLHAMRLAKERLTPRRLESLYLIMDVLTAFILGKVAKEVAKRLLERQEKDKAEYHKDAEDLLLKEEDVGIMEKYVQVTYLFNPYTLLCCAAKTTTLLDNLLLALFLLFFVRKQLVPSCLFLALSAYKGFYPIMLLVPLCVILSEDMVDKTKSKIFFRTVLPVLAAFSLFASLLLYASYVSMGESCTFLAATYGFVLSVPELTPNMGLFWYFFTEMFEHFRVFFVCTFQLNVFVYVVPLTIRLRREPFLLAFTLIGLTAIFKSYPSYGDVGFYLSLLPMLKYLFPYTKQLFIVGCMFLATTVLGPLLYHLWIYNGSANANYFFAINLVFGTAQIFLVTDLLFGFVKREFYVKEGYKNGPKLILK